MPDVGTAQRITITFRDADNDLIDPTLVEIFVRAPNGDETSLDVDHDIDDDGVYTATFTPDEPGIWHGIARGSGNVDVTRAFSKEYDPLPFDPDD